MYLSWWSMWHDRHRRVSFAVIGGLVRVGHILNNFSCYTSLATNGRCFWKRVWLKAMVWIIVHVLSMFILRVPKLYKLALVWLMAWCLSSDIRMEQPHKIIPHCLWMSPIIYIVLKNRTIRHTQVLWKLARSRKQLPLSCPPGPCNLPDTAFLNRFQSSWWALKSTE